MKFNYSLETASKQLKEISLKFALGDLVRVPDGEIGVVVHSGANLHDYLLGGDMEGVYLVSFPEKDRACEFDWLDGYFAESELEALGEVTS